MDGGLFESGGPDGQQDIAKCTRSDFAAEFREHFWPLVWRKDSKDRAYRAYCKARTTHSMELIITGVRATLPRFDLPRDHPQWRNRQLLPATWLNDHGYLDPPLGNADPAAKARTAAAERAAAFAAKCARERAESDRINQARAELARRNPADVEAAFLRVKDRKGIRDLLGTPVTWKMFPCWTLDELDGHCMRPLQTQGTGPAHAG